MHGRFFKTPNRFLILAQFFLWPAILAFVVGILGVRVNVTNSVPVGFYFVSSAREATFVEFCPPEPFGSMSVERGYRRRSSACLDGGEPLAKPIIASEGDLVEVTARGIRVNGLPIPNTQPRLEDTLHRPLFSWPVGSYRVAPGTVWVASSFNARSFDSRYFGPIRLNAIKNRLRPFWTIE